MPRGKSQKGSAKSAKASNEESNVAVTAQNQVSKDPGNSATEANELLFFVSHTGDEALADSIGAEEANEFGTESKVSSTPQKKTKGSRKRTNEAASAVKSPKAQKKTVEVAQIEEHNIQNEEDDDEKVVAFETLVKDESVRVDGDKTEAQNEDADEDKEDYVDETGRKPAWVDEDDENMVIYLKGKQVIKRERQAGEEDVTAITAGEYMQQLREKFTEANPTASWANIETEKGNTDDDSDDDDQSDHEGDEKALRKKSGDAADAQEGNDAIGSGKEQSETELRSLLHRNFGFIEKKSTKLGNKSIAAIRIPDGNCSDPFKSRVISLLFHPTLPILFSLSDDRYLRLYQIDGRKNPRVQHMYFKNDHPYKGLLSVDGSELFVTCKQSYFYSYALDGGQFNSFTLPIAKDESLGDFVTSPDGQMLAFALRHGGIVFVSAKTKKIIKQVKMNGNVLSMLFSHDGRFFYSGGKGQIFKWDIQTFRCVSLITDHGSTETCGMALSRDGKYFVTGSNCGIVNIYSATHFTDTETDTPRRSPTPIKVIEALVTKVSGLVFNHDTQLLAIFSSEKPRAVRLVHMESLSSYMNFPAQTSDLGRVTNVVFSPNSGYIGFANTTGTLPLFRLKYYGKI